MMRQTPLHGWPRPLLRRMGSWGGIFLGLLLWVFVGAPALAGETGTLRGSVRDASNGEPLEGVVVTVVGESLPGERTQTTGKRGGFWFPVLAPGNYRVSLTKEGYQPKIFDVTIRLDQTTSIPPVEMELVTFTTETIEIIESSPVIDSTQSAVQETVDGDYFESIPVGRSYQSIIRTLPGVMGRINYQNGGPSDGNPSVRGEGRYGNNYLLEGFSIRDPVQKTTGVDFPFEALDEISVYTDGAPAEFGTFTGMIANMVLKTGSNETHGSLSWQMQSHASVGEYEILGEPVARRQFFFQTPVATLGGPVVEDKLWYFSVFSIRRGWRRIEGADIPTEIPYDMDFSTKFTYNPFEDSGTLINFIVQKQSYEVINAGSNSSTAPEASRNGVGDAFSMNANLKTVLSPSTVLEAKWNSALDESGSEPASGTYFDSAYTDLYTGYQSGNAAYVYSTQRLRKGVAFHLTRYVTDKFGQHVIKGGYEHHQSSNQDEFRYTGGTGTEEDPAYEYLFLDADGDQIFDPGEEYLRTAHFNVGPLGHTGRQNAFFLQDQWQPVPSLTLNLGARVDNEALEQNAGLDVINQWMVSPRVGIAWDVKGDARDVFTLNAGRYYDMNGLTFADWADTRSSNSYEQCEWNPETQDYDLNCYTQDPVASPVEYAEGLRPYHLDKFTLGFTHAFPYEIAVGLKGIVSATRELPEDTQVVPNAWVIENPDIKRRDYWAIELNVRRRLLNNWQVLAALTYSRAKGTSPGSFESGSVESTGGSGNAVGVFADHFADPYLRMSNDYWGIDFGGLGYTSWTGFGRTTEGNTEGWYGYLPYHSFWNLKLNGSYRFDFGTEVGLAYEFDSGHAWQRRGLQELYGNHLTFPEGRGVRFMPPVHYLDLRVAHEFALPADLTILAELVIFNILDLEQAVTYYENYNQSEDLYGSGVEGQDPNTNFGAVLYRQAPRQVRANLTFRF